MVERKELLNYAIKGLGADISAIEERIERGYNLIDRINRNVAKTTKSKEEITETIEKYQQNRNELIRKRDNLLFDEMMADTDEATESRENHIIKIALSSILSKDTEKLGNLFLEDISKLLDKIALKPYCEKIGKRYDELTDDDKEVIAEIQMNDYIDTREKYLNEVDEGRNCNE